MGPNPHKSRRLGYRQYEDEWKKKMKKVKLVRGGVRVIYDLPLRLISLHCYAALLPRRGPHIASHSVCLSVRPSVRPSRYRCHGNVFSSTASVTDVLPR